MTGDNAVIRAIQTARTVRTFADREVPRELVIELVRAATCAPSPRNTQPWEFVVVEDASVRARIGEALEPRAREIEGAIGPIPDGPKRRMYEAGARMARSVGRAPVVVFVCGRPVDFPPPHDNHELMLSALFTAAQNLRLAARSLGLASAFTNLHVHAEEELRVILAIPDDVWIAATIPLGWPTTEGGPVRRGPVEDVLHWNAW